MPNRILKESIKTSPQIDRLRPDEEAFLYRLMVTVDDFGRMDARIPILASAMYPLRRTPHSVIHRRLDSIVAETLVEIYEVGGRPYLYFPKWETHQRIRNQHSKYPEPPLRAVDSDPPTGDSDSRPKSQSDSKLKSETRTEMPSSDGQEDQSLPDKAKAAAILRDWREKRTHEVTA